MSFCAPAAIAAVASLLSLVALSFDGRRALPRTALWVLLQVAMSLALLGMGLMACYMVPEKRATFYKVRTRWRGLDVLTLTPAVRWNLPSHNRGPNSTSRSRAFWTSTAGRTA